LQQSVEFQRYWTDEGKWKGLVGIPQMSLQELEIRLEGGKKALFMQFVSKMLQWDPERRQTAREILTDPWLNAET